MNDEITGILKQYWGYDAFRPLQREIIESVLAKKDVLALLPTGAGKSICFQVPAMAQEGICLVISPLIALMKDQVANLNQRGILALAIYSGMHFLEVKKTLQNAAFGNYKFLYVSPERLETDLFKEYVHAISPSMIVIDEAHCISQWGYDFRPPYLRIANLRETLPQVPVIALTASATEPVQNDICEKLAFRTDHIRYRQSFERANLSYSVFQPASKHLKLMEILRNVPGTAIVYCKSRKLTQQIAELLKANKIGAEFYHAGLDHETRNLRQQNWIENKTRVIVCTNAFGMGIDKPDVRVVVHYDVPDCMENYYQEAGRAGRDGKKAYAVLLYEKPELENLLYKLDLKYPNNETLVQIYQALFNYLQVAAGSGEGMHYTIDLASFASNFKLNILQATYAIQAMAQEGLLTYNEMFFKPTSVFFTASKLDLDDFAIKYPVWDELIKGLLRSYEGIFDYPCNLYESALAKFLKMPYDQVIKGLTLLHQHGIIQYEPASEKPQIYLLQNRMYKDAFKIDSKRLALLKQTAQVRVKAITDYCYEKVKCRSKLIGTYFGDPDVPVCKICDNCINKVQLQINDEEFQQILNQITIKLETEQPSMQNLLDHFQGLQIKPDKVWEVVYYMIAENLLESDIRTALKKPGKLNRK